MSRADSPAWLAAKKAGDETERLVADWLLSRGADVLRYEGRANADLEARWRFECKHDRMALQSGKVAIEIAYKGAPSGIYATEAAHWFVHVGDEVLMVETRVLRGLVEARPFDTVAAGDGKRAQVKLVPLADLRGISRTTIPVRRGA